VTSLLSARTTPGPTSPDQQGASCAVVQDAAVEAGLQAGYMHTCMHEMSPIHVMCINGLQYQRAERMGEVGLARSALRCCSWSTLVDLRMALMYGVLTSPQKQPDL
jgi:hypothetical protein